MSIKMIPIEIKLSKKILMGNGAKSCT